MKPVLIFGAGKIADVVSYFMVHVSKWPVVAFVVDADRKEHGSFSGFPVLTYEECKQRFTPDEADFFVAIGYHELNRSRASIIAKLKADGYKILSYVHPDSGIPADLKFGENTFIMNQVLIHPHVVLGNDNFIWSGAMIGHHCRIGNHNWFTSNCQISGNVTVKDFNFFAVNATVGHSVEIGSECFLGANVLVTKNAHDKSVFIEESTKPFRLTSDQFLRFSSFSNL